MKKEYINPEMQIVKVKTATVLAASEYSTMGFGSGTTSTMDASEYNGSDDSEEW